MDPGMLAILVVTLSIVVLALLAVVLMAFSRLSALRTELQGLRSRLERAAPAESAADPEPLLTSVPDSGESQRVGAPAVPPAAAPPPGRPPSHTAHRKVTAHPPSATVRHPYRTHDEPGTEIVEIVVHGRSASLAAIRADLPGKTSYPTTIAGESLDLTELERARTHRRASGDGEALVDAILMREPANTHDPNAVAVYLAGFGPVGHLPHGAAQEWGPVLLDYEQKAKAVLVTRAAIRGLADPSVWLRTDLATARSELERYLQARELQPV